MKNSFCYIRYQSLFKIVNYTLKIYYISVFYSKVFSALIFSNLKSDKLFCFLPEKANLVLRTFDSPIMDLEALEVSGLLEILAKSSSFEVFHNKLLHDNNLLICTLGCI